MTPRTHFHSSFTLSTRGAKKPNALFPSCPCTARWQCNIVLANEIEMVVCWEGFEEITAFLIRRVTHMVDIDSPHPFSLYALPFFLPGMWTWCLEMQSSVYDHEATSQEWYNRKLDRACILHDIMGPLANPWPYTSGWPLHKPNNNSLMTGANKLFL